VVGSIDYVPSYRLVNVFAAEDGSYGNPLGVFVDGSGYSEDERQAIATDLGYSETVFVDDAETGRLQIFTPVDELPFAGHPLVGTGRVLGAELLRPPAGEVPTWEEGELRWIRARAEWAPEMEFREYGSPAEVDALDGAPDGLGFVDCWAWEDAEAGVVRVRVFVSELNIPEDEATGAAAVRMGAMLGRALEIHQGKGSVIHVRMGPDGTVEIGGRVVDRGEQPYDH
jgi:predicted PhzF superfamily epimerase YddE/YHI9